jgi:hypothetical protein|tara:strand:- start:80046 stop:80549 length:504 start_codon:yes stop_codon:yes gene_type:complete
MVKEITAQDLQDWQEPFERILSHMYTSKTGPAIQIPEEHKQKLIEDAFFLKSLYERSGVVVSNLNKIIEIDKNNPSPSSHMEFTCKLLGFRGSYVYKKFDDSIIQEMKRKNIDSAEEEVYDLCITRVPTKISEVNMHDGGWYVVISRLTKKFSFSVRAYRYLTAVRL